MKKETISQTLFRLSFCQIYNYLQTFLPVIICTHLCVVCMWCFDWWINETIVKLTYVWVSRPILSIERNCHTSGMLSCLKNLTYPTIFFKKCLSGIWQLYYIWFVGDKVKHFILSVLMNFSPLGYHHFGTYMKIQILCNWNLLL